jgi:hypothetical protein
VRKAHGICEVENDLEQPANLIAAPLFLHEKEPGGLTERVV